MERRNAATALISGGIGTALGATVTALLAARPAQAAPENEKLDYLIELQTVMVQLLTRLVEIGENGDGQVPTIHGLASLFPEAIIDFMQVGAPKGRIQVIGFAVPIAVLAGGTTTWQFRLPDGWVSVARTPYHFTSDFYDPLLTVQVLVEAEMTPITWGALPMTGPRDILFDFSPKRFGMDVIVNNGTLVDSVVTGEATVVWLEKSYFDEVYLPLMKALYQVAEGVAIL